MLAPRFVLCLCCGCHKSKVSPNLTSSKALADSPPQGILHIVLPAALHILPFCSLKFALEPFSQAQKEINVVLSRNSWGNVGPIRSFKVKELSCNVTNLEFFSKLYDLGDERQSRPRRTNIYLCIAQHFSRAHSCQPSPLHVLFLTMSSADLQRIPP